MNRKYFGTDGVRGPVGGSVINEEFAARLGYAAVKSLGVSGKVFLGRDTRESGLALAKAVARGVSAAGADPISLGVVPTPAVSLAVRDRGADLGVVITASHNPASDNGIKFFGREGIKLSDADEAAIEVALTGALPDGPEKNFWREENGLAFYVERVRALLPAGALQGWRIAVDTAHGATVESTPAVLRFLGAEIALLGNSPDGENINAGVGSEHPELLQSQVRLGKYFLGLAHDGDGDRCVLCDERGDLLDGDEVIGILAHDALCRDALPGRLVVVTVQSNLGLDAAIAAAGGRVVRTLVGDRYVSEALRREGGLLGGESSGHIICGDFSPTGDGLVAALRVIDVMRRTGRPLSELRRVVKKFPQGTRALRVQEKIPLEELPAFSSCIHAVERELGTRGRVLVRYSGTEPKIRLLIEAETIEAVEINLERLTTAARGELQVVE